MTTIADHQRRTAESATNGLEWIDLFCPVTTLQVVCMNTWAARWDGRTFITDNHAIWDADAFAERIDDRLPALADGQICLDPTDRDLRRVGDDTGFTRKVATAWHASVEGAAPAPDDQAAWAAGRLTVSGYRTDEGHVATTGDRASAVFVNPRRVDLLARLDLEAYLFDSDPWIHLTESGTRRIVGKFPAAATPAMTESAPVLAAIAAEAAR